MRLGERQHRACGFVVSGGWAPSSRLFSHPIPVGIGYRFYSFFHTLCHQAYRNLRIVEAEVLWIMGYQDDPRLLEIRFCRLHVFP